MGSQRVGNDLATKQQQQHILREKTYNLLSLSIVLAVGVLLSGFVLSVCH